MVPNQGSRRRIELLILFWKFLCFSLRRPALFLIKYVNGNLMCFLQLVISLESGVYRCCQHKSEILESGGGGHQVSQSICGPRTKWSNILAVVGCQGLQGLLCWPKNI